MRKYATIFLATALFPLAAYADETEEAQSAEVAAVADTPTETTADAPVDTPAAATETAFAPFTGKVTREKVRMRLEPNLDSEIVREVNSGDMFIVTGEAEEFYQIDPPKDIKAYIFRTFVLEDTVEGAHVNVRIHPDTEAPVVVQLNSGDKVNGTICPDHSKWLEITLPESVRFYIAKDFIKNIGDPHMLADLAQRKSDASHLLETTQALVKLEMLKSFEDINLDESLQNLEKVQREYPDFEKEVAAAQELRQSIQEQYLQKKIDQLEKTPGARPDLIAEVKEPVTPLAEEKSGETEIAEASEIKESQILAPSPVKPPIKTTNKTSSKTIAAAPASEEPQSSGLLAKIREWMPRENVLYHAWLEEREEGTLSDFYKEQKEEAIALSGIIEPYARPVRNKPGDYVLLSRINKLPIAFVYSTVIDLENFKDKEVTIRATERPNNNFAFPAYFVLSVE